MDRLIKAHPLYPQLSRLDDDAAVLQLRIPGEDMPHTSHDEILRSEQELRADLQTASERARKALDFKRSAYIQEENAAIERVLAGNGISAPGTAAIIAQMDATARQQEKNVDTQARQGFEAYRTQALTQSRSAIESIRQSLIERGEREYRAESDRYAQRESAFMLEQANEDAGERLLLRTRLENLALDEKARAEAKARIQALDKKEADALGALRNRDQAALAADRQGMRAHLEAQMQQEADAIQKRMLAKLQERSLQMPSSAHFDPIALPSQQEQKTLGALPADVQAKLLALHKRYRASFTKDAEQTVREFMRTRDELSARFQRLAAVDSEAQSSAAKAISALHEQRDDLYRQMVRQIDRRVRVIAGRRGIGVVLRSAAASAAGVDLTADVLHDVESLHE